MYVHQMSRCRSGEKLGYRKIRRSATVSFLLCTLGRGKISLSGCGHYNDIAISVELHTIHIAFLFRTTQAGGCDNPARICAHVRDEQIPAKFARMPYPGLLAMVNALHDIGCYVHVRGQCLVTKDYAPVRQHDDLARLLIPRTTEESRVCYVVYVIIRRRRLISAA